MALGNVVKIIIAGDASSAVRAFGEVETASTGMGAKLAGISKGAALAFPVIGAAAGVALFKIGESFDEAYDKIRTKTGAIGEELDGLKADFRSILTDVPTDMSKASDAITAVFQKLGNQVNTKAIAEQFLELSRITKTDLTENLSVGTSVLNNWGIAVADQSGKLDELFRASQQSGVGFAALAGQVTDAGAGLRGLGVTFDQSTALAATLGKAGLDLGTILPGLKKVLAEAFKTGVDGGKLLEDTLKGITTGSAGAEQAALKLFGTRAGGQLIELAKEGKLNYADLLTTIQGGTDTIIAAGKETQDFGEKWTLLKNRVLVALEPLAMKVFDGIGKAMDKLGPAIKRVFGWFSDLSAAFSDNGLAGVMSKIGDDIASAWPGIQAALVDLGKKFLAWVGDQVPPLLKKLGEWGQAFLDWIGPRIGPLLEEVGKLIGKLLDWLLDPGLPLLAKALVKFGKAFAEWIGPAIPPMLEELGKLTVQLLGWIATEALPRLTEQLGEWTVAFVKWVGPAIPKMLEELGKLTVQLLAWIATEALPMITEKLGEWTVAFVEWVVPAIAGLPEKLGQLIFAIDNWITGEALPRIVEKLGEWTLAFLGWVADAVSKIPGKLEELAGVIIDWIGKMPERIASAAVGMWDGIKDAFRSMINWIIEKWNALEFTLPRVSLGPVSFGGQTVGTPYIAPISEPLTFPKIPSIPEIGLATGTDSWRGGPTWIGEDGPEILNLPKGSQIIPNDVAKAVTSGTASPLTPQQRTAFQGIASSTNGPSAAPFTSAISPGAQTVLSAAAKAMAPTPLSLPPLPTPRSVALPQLATQSGTVAQAPQQSSSWVVNQNITAPDPLAAAEAAIRGVRRVSLLRR